MGIIIVLGCIIAAFLIKKYILDTKKLDKLVSKVNNNDKELAKAERLLEREEEKHSILTSISKSKVEVIKYGEAMNELDSILVAHEIHKDD